MAQRPVLVEAETESAQPVGRRRSARAAVSLDARLVCAGFDRALCKVTDISIHGARLEIRSPLRAGSLVWLTLPEMGHRSARVVWATDSEAGCEFMLPLTGKALKALTAS